MAQPAGPLPLGAKPVEPSLHEDTERFADEKIPIEESEVTYTAQEEKALLRRLDWRLLPVMCFTWGLAYYDKVIMGQAVLFRMRQDLDLVNPGSRYSNTSMIFYVGYIIGLPTIGLIAQRFPIGRSCAVLVFCWGLTVIMTVLCHNYPGIMVQRFFLGFIEAGIAPGFVSVIAMYYTKREQAFRAAIWVASAPATNMFSPMLNYGLGSIDPAHGWKNMYYFAGAVTMAWSAVVWWKIPDDIPRAKFLNDRQREIAMERSRRTQGGKKDHDIKWYQAWEALCDIQVWGLFILSICAYFPNGVLTTFSSLIIKDLGFSTVENLAVQIPKGFVGVIANVVPGYFAMRYEGLRFHIYTAAVFLAFAGSVALLLAPRVPGLIGALYGLHMFGAAAGQIHGLSASNIGGYTKRTVTVALTYIGYSVAQTVAPILFDTDEAPGYRKGFIATMSVTAIGTVVSQVLRFYLRRKNMQRDKEGVVGTTHGAEDITDRENRDFRYAL